MFIKNNNTFPIKSYKIGFCINAAVDRMNLSGRNLTEYMRKLLMGAGYMLSSSAEMEIVKDIKEKMTYIAHNYKEEQHKSSSKCLYRNLIFFIVIFLVLLNFCNTVYYIYCTSLKRLYFIKGFISVLMGEFIWNMQPLLKPNACHVIVV